MTKKSCAGTRSRAFSGAKNKNFQLDSWYTAAAVGGIAGAFCGFESTQAGLVVTSSTVSLANDPGAPPLAHFDLNNDGTMDVGVLIFSSYMLSAQGLNGASLAGEVGPGGFFYPTAFQPGESISSGQVFGGNSTGVPNSFGTLALSLSGTAAPGVGNWLGGQEAALGVKFSVAGSDHFGWVHVVWDAGADTFESNLVAYENVAGAAAAVIPEPSSLALLALGAVGLARRRRAD